jgi:hypothetical protein
MQKQVDLPDRTLVLKLGRLSARQPEQDLLNAVAKRRNEIWSELLDGLNAIVAYLRDHPESVPTTFRMADFASLALCVCGVQTNIFIKFVHISYATSRTVHVE